jgi:hypothetical protein
MSGLAGIYQLDGRPVPPSLLERMVQRIAHRGPDASYCWIQRSIGMGHAMLHTTPESLEEQQPWQDETGTLCLTLDGRIDNREELTGALETAGFHFRNNTDAELMLRAYQCWGEECPEHVIGDFALTVWDGPRRQVFCARDGSGRPHSRGPGNSRPPVSFPRFRSDPEKSSRSFSRNGCTLPAADERTDAETLVASRTRRICRPLLVAWATTQGALRRGPPFSLSLLHGSAVWTIRIPNTSPRLFPQGMSPVRKWLQVGHRMDPCGAFPAARLARMPPLTAPSRISYILLPDQSVECYSWGVFQTEVRMSLSS